MIVCFDQSPCLNATKLPAKRGSVLMCRKFIHNQASSSSSNTKSTTPRLSFNLQFISNLLGWYRSVMSHDMNGRLWVSCSADIDEINECAERQLSAAAEKQVGGTDHLVLLFVALCRSLGIRARYVVPIDPIPKKIVSANVDDVGNIYSTSSSFTATTPKAKARKSSSEELRALEC